MIIFLQCKVVSQNRENITNHHKRTPLTNAKYVCMNAYLPLFAQREHQLKEFSSSGGNRVRMYLFIYDATFVNGASGSFGWFMTLPTKRVYTILIYRNVINSFLCMGYKSIESEDLCFDIKYVMNNIGYVCECGTVCTIQIKCYHFNLILFELIAKIPYINIICILAQDCKNWNSSRVAELLTLTYVISILISIFWLACWSSG